MTTIYKPPTFTSSANPRPATIVVAASNATGTWDADYTCTGTADQTTIATAIAALPASGGRVLLSDGTFNVTGTIALSTGDCLEGQGFGTIIDVQSGWSGSNTGVITLANTSVHATQIKNMTIRCTSRGTNVDGIYINNSGGSFTAAPNTSPDTQHRIDNILILAPSGCGIRSTGSSTDAETAASTNSSTITSSSGNARGTWISNIFVFFAGRNGLLWHSPDSFISDFVTGDSQRSGIVMRGGNVRYSNLKSYYSTWHGVVMSGNRNEVATVEAQDTTLTGFLILGDEITASGLASDSCGNGGVGDGMYISGSYCNVEGVIYDRAPSANVGRTRYGITFGGNGTTTGIKNNIMLSIDATNFIGSGSFTPPSTYSPVWPAVYSGSPAGQLTLFLTTNGTTTGVSDSGDDLTQARFGAGRAYFNAPNTIPVDANLGNSDLSLWIDQTISARPKIKARAKTSGGTAFSADFTRQDYQYADGLHTPGGLALQSCLNGSTTPGLNTLFGVRMRAQQSGAFRGIYGFIATGSGNARVGIYTANAATGNLLWDSGAVSVAASNTWVDFGDPGSGVTISEGDWFDVVITCDNSTVTLARCGNALVNGAASQLPADFTFGSAASRIAWQYTAFTYGALPSTITDATHRANSSSSVWGLIARIV